MRKVYRMKNLDCANCAAKMEHAIGKLKDVQAVEISFMAQKLVLEADEDRLPALLEQARACVKKVDPNCEILG